MEQITRMQGYLSATHLKNLGTPILNLKREDWLNYNQSIHPQKLFNEWNDYLNNKKDVNFNYFFVINPTRISKIFIFFEGDMLHMQNFQVPINIEYQKA